MSKIMSQIGTGIDSERQNARRKVAKAWKKSEIPESRCQFFAQDIGGEAAIRGQRPEIRRQNAKVRRQKYRNRGVVWIRKVLLTKC